MATVTISGKFGNDADLARRTMVFAPLNSPFGSGDELVCGPEFSVSLDASGDASLTMLEGNYLVWLKDIPDQVATIAVPSGAGSHNINSIFATSTTAGLNSVSTGQLDYQDRTAAPSNPPSGYFKLYMRGGTFYKLNSAGSETPIAGDMVGPASSTSGNLPSFDGTGGKTLQDSGIAAADVYRSGGTDVPLVDGGTGASTASGARTNLGLVIGTNVQAWSTVLDGTTAAFTTSDETKLDGIETGADVTDATNVDAAGAVMNSDASTASMSFVVDEDTMSSDSATKVPTQQSVKAYVDANAGGASLPVDDTTAIVRDPVDNTKLARLDVGAVTTGTTRTVTIPDRDVDLSSGGTFAENSHNHAASEITSGTLTDARVAESNVTQHEAALSVAASQVSDSTAAGRTLLTAANVAAQQTALNVEDGADVTDATNVDAAGAVMNSDASTASMSFVVDEDNMVSDSATKVPTQQSVKAYVDANAGSHASNHVLGGSDEIDGDHLGITFAPSFYTPSTSSLEASNVDHLAAHLDGIDEALNVVQTDIGTNAADIATNTGDISILGGDISSHTGDTFNPHAVTKTQVGLGNVENTALSTWVGTSNITTLGALAAGVTLDEIAAPSTPATGKVVVYPKTDGKLYLKDDAGTETDLTASGGGGGGGPAEVVLDSGEFYGLITNGASPGFRELATNDVALPTLNFDDSTQEYAECRWFVPSNWDGNDIPVELEWTTAADPTGTGDDGVRWEVSVLILANDDEIDAAFSTAVAVSDTATATTGADRLYRTASFNLAAADLTADRRCIIRISRVPSHADDDMTGDAEFIAMILTPGYS
jgi:hypothetical protein